MQAGHVRLLPDAHPAIHEQHLAVDVPRGVAEQEHGGLAAHVRPGTAPLGVCICIHAIAFGSDRNASVSGVRTSPGAMPFTRMPLGASETHNVFTIISTAPFDVS